MIFIKAIEAITMTMAIKSIGPLIIAGAVTGAMSESSRPLSTSSTIMPLSKRLPSPNLFLPRKDVIRDLVAIRGGESEGPYQQHSYYTNGEPGSSIGGDDSKSYEMGFDNYKPPPPSGYDTDREASVLQESVQDRHDKWRSAQMERYANMTPEQEYNPRDEQGRMKLLSSVSKGSRAFIFFILMWRDIYLFEVTDQSIKGSLRKMITRGFLAIVFFGNIAGAVTSITSQGHSAKNRLKAILNLDKVVETTLLVWNLGRVTLFPSKFVPREIFVAGIFHSIFFLIQCQAFTRVAWDERIAPVLQQKQQNQWQQNNDQSYNQHSSEYQTTALADSESSKIDSTNYSADAYESPSTRTNSYL